MRKKIADVGTELLESGRAFVWFCGCCTIGAWLSDVTRPTIHIRMVLAIALFGTAIATWIRGGKAEQKGAAVRRAAPRPRVTRPAIKMSQSGPIFTAIEQDAVSALCNLGYPVKEASGAVLAVHGQADYDFERKFRMAQAQLAEARR
jgi:hypothetical protein